MTAKIPKGFHFFKLPRAAIHMLSCWHFEFLSSLFFLLAFTFLCCFLLFLLEKKNTSSLIAEHNSRDKNRKRVVLTWKIASFPGNRGTFHVWMSFGCSKCYHVGEFCNQFLERPGKAKYAIELIKLLSHLNYLEWSDDQINIRSSLPYWLRDNHWSNDLWPIRVSV